MTPKEKHDIVEDNISKAWTWLANQKTCYDKTLGDCFTAHSVLIALKMVAKEQFKVDIIETQTETK